MGAAAATAAAAGAPASAATATASAASADATAPTASSTASAAATAATASATAGAAIAAASASSTAGAADAATAVRAPRGPAATSEISAANRALLLQGGAAWGATTGAAAGLPSVPQQGLACARHLACDAQLPHGPSKTTHDSRKVCHAWRRNRTQVHSAHGNSIIAALADAMSRTDQP